MTDEQLQGLIQGLLDENHALRQERSVLERRLSHAQASLRLIGHDAIPTREFWESRRLTEEQLAKMQARHENAPDPSPKAIRDMANYLRKGDCKDRRLNELDLDEVEKSYNAAGFRTIHKDESSIGFSRPAPVPPPTFREAKRNPVPQWFHQLLKRIKP